MRAAKECKAALIHYAFTIEGGENLRSMLMDFYIHMLDPTQERKPFATKSAGFSDETKAAISEAIEVNLHHLEGEENILWGNLAGYYK